ncbi:MAG: RagB/SusD family nutrient uptake outer membrane protein [Bacteroidota bacterium]|nr:RagB/SusD family nutrient uptake outer membrane protein [Bacteroidota bacterium]
MKKIVLKKFLLALSSIYILSACGKYLEENPDNRVELNSIYKASQLITNAYSNYGYNFTEWMTDNVTYTYGTTILPQHNEAYSWSDFSGIDQDTPTGFWNSSYEAIAHSNEVLAVINTLPGEEAQRNAVKGEALLARAYNHFMLVNIFAQHYDALTANKDMGIPYVEEPEREFLKKYERLSVEEVYRKIERDLLEGLELVNDNYYANSGKYHFTVNASLAFASRFYLFKNDYNKSIEYSTRLFAGNPATFVKDVPALMRDRVNPEDYIRRYTSPNDESNILLIKKISNFHANAGHWPSNSIINEIYSNNPWGADDTRNIPYRRGENGVIFLKHEQLFERLSLTANVGYNYTSILAFRGEEVLLNRAESYVFQNKIKEALADLQLIVNKRYDGNNTINLSTLRRYYGTPSSRDREIILDFIIAERRKEFIHEGLRWFDIKRFNLPVLHVAPDGQNQISLEEDDLRKVIQIPQAAIDVGGLKPNPR